MNIVESYSKNLCKLSNMWFDDPRTFDLLKEHVKVYGNTHLSYCLFWSSKIFKKEFLHQECLEYHDFIGYIKSERKNHGKLAVNKLYSTIIEFNRDNQRIIWKLKPSKPLRKILSGAFRVIAAYTDGSNIHMIYSKNGTAKYIKFDYNDIEVSVW